MNASDAQAGAVGEAAGAAGAAGNQDAMFDAVREQAEAMIAWVRSREALAMEHGQLETRTWRAGWS